MSVSYFIVCMECRTGVNLGKPVKRTYENVGEESIGFSSLVFTEGAKHASYNYLLRSVEELDHFLMLHRSHELRVLPETADLHATDIGFPNSFPVDDDSSKEYNRLVFLSQSVGEVDPCRDLESLKPEIIKNLEKF